MNLTAVAVTGFLAADCGVYSAVGHEGIQKLGWSLLEHLAGES
jgi:hypothetical protein